MDILKAVLLFILGLLLLIKGGDWFVDGATGIAKKFKIPDLIIGATVVSIGTTLPEVMVSAGGALAGNGSIAYGNAIGSIICNTALISALTIAIKPAEVDRRTMICPIIFFFVSAIFYSIVAYFFKEFSRLVGILLLLLFIAYMITTIITSKKNPQLVEVEEEAKEIKGGVPVMIFLLVLGAVCIAFGARFLIDNGTILATAMGVPDSVIALTLIALGTSLPELVTAITSLIKGHSSLSIGNIIGANLFNLVLVSGVAITLSPFELPCEKTIFDGLNASLVMDIPIMLFVMLLMALPPLITKKLYRWQGILLLLIYAGFCVVQFAF